MSEVVGIVVAHGDLARSLVEAAEQISGVRGALTAVSNRDCTPEQLRRRVSEAVGSGPAIVFADLVSGSCGFACRAARRDHARVAMVTGVNLPALLEFLFHREMEVTALAERLVEKARAGTSILAAEPELPDADRSVPHR
ncbi:MAG: PTS sugar transporter subunit IIA [Gemmatimonadota bacterium]